MEYNYTISSEGCLALLDPETYKGFIGEDWSVKGIKDHFISENEKGAIIAWGCDDGNWNVSISNSETDLNSEQCFDSVLKTNGKILLTSYESLTMAAQFDDVSLPESHENGQVIELEPGFYQVTVKQKFASEDSGCEKVFSQKAAHFELILKKVNELGKPLNDIPWFQGY
ncbi:hypothetical protein TUM4438_45330 [Shewanella sairae]|uniref:Uncharacterized protein n=1 Tax=Shewanella sairae TaxID=190310 RepID=A0ABQ4PRR1_9GAMM|nr:hypothetical protein [Shewanella sairae]MCL1132576.1 hypothetical protein [Shewanella sairae]GIU52482.1 hypothetical protein TUM4438_45330 [Shewanella sairae]